MVGETNITSLPEAVTGTAIGYAGPESYVFDGSFEDNLLYGLKHAPIDNDEPPQDEKNRDFQEAIASGNSAADLNGEWIDYAALGMSNVDDLKAWMMKVIYALDLDSTLITRVLTM
jgi:putative ABC transport system ATP-binding protein